MPRARLLAPHKRRGYWYLARKVPKRYRHLDKRSVVLLSTTIAIADDPRGIAARAAVQRLSDELDARWRSLANEPLDDREQFARTVQITTGHGLPYKEGHEVIQLPLPDLLHRLNILKQDTRSDTVSAMLGGAPRPDIKLSQLVDEYTSVVETELLQKSPRQRKRWRQERDTAMALFRAIIGDDLPLHQLTRQHAMAFRDHWKNRAMTGAVDVYTCNRNFGRISAMLKAVSDHHRLELAHIFQGLRLLGQKTKSRTAFAPAFIQDHLLATGSLDGLNHEARRILYLMVETGVRITEACNLNKTTIILDHNIPHIRIRPDGRQLKTDQSVRDIPLVGVALMAMRAQPEGFPTYHDKADVVSATVNKFLRENKLLPNGETLYSIRHSFKDRLRKVRCLDEVDAYLMGHKGNRPKYGQPTLEDTLYWLDEMAFKRLPSHI